MKMRYLAIMVVIVMMISALAGCQSATSAPTTAGSTTSGGTTAPTTQGPPVKLTGITTTQSPDTKFPYPIENVMAAAANVEISWQNVGIQDWAAQKPVLLASGEIPDIWFAASLSDSEANSGVFLDLAPYIDKTTNIKRFFAEVPDAVAFCTNPEGTIFGLPSRHALRTQAADTLYVNKAWCDNLGIGLPTTIDEYEAMLQKFVTMDPNKDGQINEVGYTGYFILPFIIPGAQVNSIGTLQCFLPSFGVMVGQGMTINTLCQIVDGKVVFAPTMDGYKKALIWLNKLYAAGLIDKELFNLDPPAMMAKLGAEGGATAGSGSAWSKEAFCFANAPQFEYIAPLKGPNGEQYWRSDNAFAMFGNTATIAKTCKDPEAAMRFYDLCYDEWNSLQICYGSDGVGTSHDADGKPILIPGPDGSTADAFRFTCASELGPGWASEAYGKTVGGKSDTFLKNNASAFYEPYFKPEFRYPVVKWDKGTADQLAILQVDINTYVDTAFVNFVMKGGVEEGWAAYLEQMNKMGLANLMTIYEKGYADSKK